MSYHEISVKQKFDGTCFSLPGCSFTFTADSAGEAETKAREHVDENYSHSVSITTRTVVDRE